MRTILTVLAVSLLLVTSCTGKPEKSRSGPFFTTEITDSTSKSFKSMKFLTPEERAVILNKGTEKPFSGRYETFSEKGTYLCKQCHAPLYRSEDK
ncbi:MAG: peptide-methionine (R)-S-oxide reductase, partial [Bacteroidota bacterium]|nr:peptide-methionine (R)-S-oxide reductase [Bacteroidota bacterium]